MAVPKKRTSKAKKNKRKTVWKQKPATILERNEARMFRARPAKWVAQDVIGFKPELRFKYQPADQLRSKTKHFMDDKARLELQQESKARLSFNPESKEKLEEEIKARFASNALAKEEKQTRVAKKKNRKKLQRNPDLDPNTLK